MMWGKLLLYSIIRMSVDGLCLCDVALLSSITDHTDICVDQLILELETASIAEPLQNRQHAQTPYLGEIRHVTMGQWSIYLQLNVICVLLSLIHI